MAALNIHHTLGAVFVGFVISCVVYGILMTQAYHYFRCYPLDRLHFKITVIVLALLVTTDQAFIGHIIYYYAISNFARLDILLRATMTWSLILQLTVGAVVGTIVKTYFALRVWRFSGHNIFITALLLLLTYAQLGLAIAYSVRAFQLPNIFAVHQLQTLGSVSLGTGVATDILTAIALCYFLNELRTGYKSSDSLVNMLCSYAINTGVLTSTVSLTTLILYNVMPANNLYFIATYFILSKLYAISFMATLNTRRQVRGRGTDQQHTATVTNNNTNMFHLGTRMPSMGPDDFEQGWDKVMPPGHIADPPRGKSVLRDPPQYYADHTNEFPYNSFYQGGAGGGGGNVRFQGVGEAF